MGFPFNLHAIDWAAQKVASGKSAAEVPELLAALADDQPLVREEAARELEELFAAHGALAPVTPLAAEPLFKLVESEAAKGRGRAAMLLAHLALEARTCASTPGQALLDLLEDERGPLETLTTRHAASTPLGAALRALISVLGTAALTPQLASQLEIVEALVSEADLKDEAAPPTAEELDAWLTQVKQGRGQAVAFAQRALAVDPRAALTILETDPKPGSTSVQRVHRAVLRAQCLDAIGRPAVSPETRWSLTEQALLLDATERHCAKSPKVARQLLEWVNDPSHAVHRRAVEVRVLHANGQVDAGWTVADQLALEWLAPAKAGSVNQCLERSELLRLLALFGVKSAARTAEVTAAPAPEVALPAGETL